MPSFLALNVANPPKERARQLLEWLWHREEDVLVLTEVGRSEGSHLLETVCRAAGFAAHRTSRTELGVLVVGRMADVRRDDRTEPPALLPHRVLAVQVDGIAVAAVYGAASDPVRYARREQRQRKRDWLVAFDAWLAAYPPDAVIGDLNVVDPLHDDRLPYVLPEETAFYAAMGTQHGLVDAVRRTHPDDRSPSWVDHSGVGCRYDHAFVTADLADDTTAGLDHEPRLSGLTDHSALILTVR